MSDTPKDISSLLASRKTEFSTDPVDLTADAQLNSGQILCGDLDIRIDLDGTWFYHGSPIGRKELVRLFSTVLHKDREGRYWLITPAEKGEIVVEDVPFMAVEMDVIGGGEDQSLQFRTNVDDIVMADSDHPLRIITNSDTGEPSPYLMIRDGLEARLTRSVYYQLVELGLEKEIAGNPEETVWGVWSGGEFFEIGRMTS